MMRRERERENEGEFPHFNVKFDGDYDYVCLRKKMVGFRCGMMMMELVEKCLHVDALLSIFIFLFIVSSFKLND